MKPILFLSLLAFVVACSPARRISRELRTKPVYTDHFMGVALYDPVRRQSLIQYNADRLFTPASNTKLFTFYAGLLTLPDSLPALRYVSRNDSLIFWGTGNPLLLHPDLPDTTALAFLRSHPETLVFSSANYTGPRFGPGWSWDDYNDDFLPELASLPVYGNVVRFDKKQMRPNLFTDSSRVVEKGNGTTQVRRDEFANTFIIPSVDKLNRQDVPFRWSTTLAARLLADTLHRPVGVAQIPVFAQAKLLRGTATDSLYKRMLHVSDNQFAEQVLFMIAAERGYETLDQPTELRRIMDSVLRYPAMSAKWVDGSGLSRYNLFTPNVLIDLLGRIYASVSQQRLFTLLPAAGQSGTLRSLDFKGKPYVFAKSGSLTGVYNLSGYIQTKRGKTLFFSIMHNNFAQPTSEMRRRTAELLKEIHERF